jgi:polar amino acid transport system substrate-binding protein
MIEIAKEILTPKNISVDYEILPWARALAYTRIGRTDCVVGAYKSDAPDFIFPELAWGMDQNIFYVKKNNSWRYTGFHSLSHTRIGLIQGYSYGKELKLLVKATKHKNLFEYTFGENALKQNIAKVLAGRLTATIESYLVMPEELSLLGLENEIIPAGNIGNPIPMYIACSPKKASSKRYTQWFDEGIRTLRTNGRLKIILSKYHLDDWEKQTISSMSNILSNKKKSYQNKIAN